MDLMDLISGNSYVGQNFPAGMPPAQDGGDDPIAKLRQMLLQSQAEKAIPSGAPDPAMAPPMDAPQPIPPAGPLPFSGPTEFSARARQPLNIPLQQPGPPMSLAPDNPGPTAPQQPNSLLSMIAPGLAPGKTAIDKAMASLGGGLSTVAGNTAGGAFARGMGGGLKSGTAFDKSDQDKMLKAIALAQKAKAEGNDVAYKQALTQVANVTASLRQQQAKALETGRPISNRGERPARTMDPRLLFDKAERAVQNANRAIDGDFRLKPEEKAARKAAEATRIYKGFGLNPDGTDAGGAKPSRSAKKAGKAGEIAFDGDGTQAAPYAPATKDDYDQIESGTYYIHPSSGEVRLKK